MATEKVDGFRLDRVGRLLSTAYAELHVTPGLEELVLRPFAPGVLLHSDGRHHRAGVQPGSPARTEHDGREAHFTRCAPWRAPPSGAAQAGRGARTAGVRAPQQGRRPAGHGAGPGAARRRAEPAGGHVGGAAAGPPRDDRRRDPARPGLPARTVDGFLRPLLAALLCDPELITSSRTADLALRDFARGRLCLPEGGAEALPQSLARSLPPGTVHTGVRVTSVSTTSVTTAEHGEFRCAAVLVATGARDAAELLPGLRVPDFHPVTVVHHTTDEPPGTDASLLLDADRGGPVAHTAVASAVDPSRAPAGRTLVTSTVLGPATADTDTAVRAHLARLYGVPTARWETLAVRHTADAAP